MTYTQHYTTRWHDTDAERRVRPTQILVYMQETSNGHIATMGTTLEELRDRDGLAFILSKIRIVFHKPLFAYEDIDVETWTVESRGFSSTRYFRVLRGGEVVAECESVWALVGLNDKKLHRFDEIKFNWEHGEPITLDMSPRFRVPKTEELDLFGTRRIVYSDLDYNMHMNNTRYADMLCDFLPIDLVGKVRGMTLTYLHEAHFGDEISVYGKRDGERYLFRTVGGEGQACLEAEVILN